MNLNHIYWAFTGVISDEDCKEIIKIAKRQKLEKAKVFKSSFDLEAGNKLRNSEVCFLNNPFIYDLLHPFLNIANRNAGWNFQYDYSESAQFTSYKKHQHYGWHQDCILDQHTNNSDPNFRGKIRKLSMIMSLSDPKAYKGGALEFYIPNPEKKSIQEQSVTCHEIEKKGSVVVFPSFMWHRVLPVTKGTRYSLVMWTLGQNYK